LLGAAQLIEEKGPDALSMRELARRAGVSHAAPAHHFGDRIGLFTALAAQGFSELAQALEASVAQGKFDLTAVAYVRFAVQNRGHYAVMFRPDLLNASDPTLAAAQAEALALLEQGLASVPARRLRAPAQDAQRSAWALVHGLASLINAGALPAVDAESLALAAAKQLFGG
jgi:AcrR family transcriptional regulator